MRKNKEIADRLDSLADILEFKGENPFKINAYKRAATTLRDLTQDVQDLVDSGRLKEISGIGEGIYKKIVEYLKTGMIEDYEKEKKEVPLTLIDLMYVPSLGPKSLAKLHKVLGVEDTETLKKAINSGKAEILPGFGKKKVQNILHGLDIYTQSKKRVPLGIILPLVKELMEEVHRIPGVLVAEPAGSLRRGKGTIGDLDILVTGDNGEEIIKAFTEIPQAVEELAAGKTKGSIITRERFQVDLRVIPDDSFGAALQYFTGSKEHNIKLRGTAKDRGYKINEYGLFKDSEVVASKTEEEIYKAVF